ncbi:MAG: molybdopterin-dependent oxidoreductase [Sulfurimonas sp.]|uniref:molybdopterin-dependent oxidoreductase n=1 Tax=Sulfurimonas sp. TaxID=2022749 RepID=UPI0025D40999|nr:molybdopterin-dependent oxidoreductase [Sulfurimonas sp.]MCK9491913.1 molybdopterin-dependent oxidoreductase [Sulfurimonas sp.]
MQRRDFFRLSLSACAVVLGSNVFGSTREPLDNQRVIDVAFPQKRPLITYSDRPPLLETPMEFFKDAITPNDAFFVRWHMPRIPVHKYIDTYRLSIHGAVKKHTYLSLDELKSEFEQVEITAVMQCGGNSRSAFVPTTSGIQWGNGAMGCAKFKGVRLKDVLDRVGLDKDARWVGLNGDDKAAFHKTENFKRELALSEINENVIIAYEMNGEELPFLNGYPIRLIVPGMYSDSWVKMLSNISVTKEYQELFYMDKAYRIADNECECEEPDNLAKKTKPITTMNIKSVIAYPKNGSSIKVDANIVAKGVAFDSGNGIKEVLISVDDGKNWAKAELGDELSLFAFREFKFAFRAKSRGVLTIMAKAINNLGEEQPKASAIKWNRGGYKYNGIDTISLEVV